MTLKHGKYDRVLVYCTMKEKAFIKECAKRHGLSMSEYMLEMHRQNQAKKDSKKEIK